MKISKMLLMFAMAIAMVNCSKTDELMDTTGDVSSMESIANEAKNYIVVLKSDVLKSQALTNVSFEEKKSLVRNLAQETLQDNGIGSDEISQVYGKVLNGFVAKMTTLQAKELELDARVEYVEEDQLITLSDAGAPAGDVTVKAVAAQTVPWGITRVGGGISSTGVAWIIDTGIDLDHPDLNVDTNHSAVFITGRNVTPDDQNGHGSHVAGIVAAIDNGSGVIGVAAGATVISVRVLDRRGSGYVSWIVAGIDYVAANGTAGDVANMSLGGGISTTLDDAVYNASFTGIRFVLAAGNESMDANNTSPARVNGTYIYTISAMDSNDIFAYFSNYGSPVDYCAPGVSIYSTYKNASYATLSGTSMAAPHVAGLLLLGSLQTDGYVSNDPDGNPDPIAHH